MNLKSLLAATALCSVMFVPAYAQTTPKMREVLKIWQLDKPSPSTQFVTKSVTEDRTVLENVVFKNPATKKTDVSFGQLILQRLPQVDAATDQARFSVSFLNGTVFQENGEDVAVGKLEISGLTTATNLETFAKWASGSTVDKSASDARFDGDIRASNMSTKTKDSAGKVADLKIGDLNLLGLSLSETGWSAKTVEMLNTEVVDSEAAVKLGKISVSNFKSNGWESLDSSSNFLSDNFDFKKLSIDSMLIEGVAMDIQMPAEKEKAENLKFTMDRMELTNWTDKNIGRFGLSGMKATTGQGDKRIDMRLESFTLDDINVAYYSALGSAFMKAVPNLDKKPSGRSALLGFAELASASASAAATTAAPAKSVTTAPSPKLKDLLPGGPLDGGIGAIAMSNFGFEVMGFNFTIDKIATSTVRNGDGIITESKLAPITMKLTIPEALLNQPDSPMAMFAPLVADGIELVIRADASYDPVTDVVKFDDLNYTLNGWAGFNLDMSMDGFAKFYREQTVDSLIAPFAADMKKLNDPKGKGAKKPDTTEDLKALMAIYKGVRFLNGALELRDQGGLAKAAGVFASMMAPPAKGATSRTAAQDAQAVAQVRTSWAEPLRKSAAEKNKSIMERQFLIALARWIEVGGVMTAAVQPPAPLDLPALANEKDLQTRLGLTFTNQPAAKN
ncbi:MAG: hypothetical protein ACK5Z6_00080 [Hyphomonadaceae bacterium]